MKKVAIITIYGNINFGNKLQNYALQEYIKKIGNFEVITIKERNTDIKSRIKRFIKKIIGNNIDERTKKFIDFNKYINYSKKFYSRKNPKKLDNYDYYIVGSDQVWNPKFNGLSDLDLLKFTNSKNKISYAASFGVSNIDNKYDNKVKEIGKFKKISVRENDGKKILSDFINKEVNVLIDPTMLLTNDDWEKIMVKPSNLNKNTKYILTYFLGKLSEEKMNAIKKVAEENKCEIINLLDKNSSFYNCGPSEFLYLEKNAFLICTYSFHSCVFSILFDRPFVVFDRDDNLKSMNSRIETLINTFNIKDRYFSKSINNSNIKHNYKEAYKILEKERLKSKKYLMESLDVGDNDE